MPVEGTCVFTKSQRSRNIPFDEMVVWKKVLEFLTNIKGTFFQFSIDNKKNFMFSLIAEHSLYQPLNPTTDPSKA